MKVAVAVVLVIAFLATFAMATLTFEEAQARLSQIQQLKQLLSEEESALQNQLMSDSETETELSHSDAAARLRAVGISTSSSCGCSNRYNGCCTSLDGVNTKNIDGIITLKRSSGCPITVTGGTETGHASGAKSHWTGYKLDISVNSCIDSYIKSNFRYSGVRGDGAAMYTASSGNVYAREGNHWDILYP